MKIPAFLIALLLFQQAFADTRQSWEMSAFPEPARIINNSGVRVRAVPEMSGKEITKLSVGTITHELQRTDSPVKLGDMQDYWYLIKLRNGQQGWIFGAFSAPVEKENIELTYLDIIKKQFQDKQDNFNDLVDLSNFLQRIGLETQEPDFSAVFRLLHLLSLQAAARLLPDEVDDNQTYHTWTNENAVYLFHIPLGDGGWMVNPEVFWRLREAYQSSVTADEIAWQAAENGIFSDCEIDLSCDFEVINATYGKYLKHYPDGKYAQSALKQISKYLRWIAGNIAEDNFDKIDKDEVNYQVRILRQAISETQISAGKPVLNQLENILQTPVSANSSDIQEEEEDVKTSSQAGKEIIQSFLLKKLAKGR